MGRHSFLAIALLAIAVSSTVAFSTSKRGHAHNLKKTGSSDGGGDIACKPPGLTCKPDESIFFGPEKHYEACSGNGAKFANVSNGKLTINCSGKAGYSEDGMDEDDKKKMKSYSGPVDLKGEFVWAFCDDKQQLLLSGIIKPTPRKVRDDESNESSHHHRESNGEDSNDGGESRPQGRSVANGSNGGVSGGGGSDKPNIIMLSMDAVSSACFEHALPKTKAFVHAENDKYQGFKFDIFSTVAHASFGNQVPLYSGCMADELEKKQTCHDAWLWKLAKNSGYTTTFAEEFCPKTGGRADTVQPFFKKFPVDHDLSPLFCEGSDFMDKYWPDKPFCVDERAAQEIIFEHIDNTITNSGNPVLSMVNVMDGHDPPICMRIKRVDDSLEKFLKQTLEKKPNTIIFLMADHGNQFGPFYETECGYNIHHLPTLRVIMPKALMPKAPHLNTNTKRLVTAKDVYRTIASLVGSRSRPQGAFDLFKEEVPASRHCKEAGIPVRWCACVNWKEKQPGDAEKKVVGTAIEFLNKENKKGDGDICVNLELKQIAKYWEGQSPNQKTGARVLFETQDGAKWAAFVEMDGETPKLVTEEHGIARSSLYKPDSEACHPSKHGKTDEYCVCKSRVQGSGGGGSATSHKRAHLRRNSGFRQTDF